MAYCLLDNVQSLIPTSHWDSSNDACQPATWQVEKWIEEIDAEIDSKLSSRYETPITGEQSLAIIQSISARLVAIRLWGDLFAGDRPIPEDWKRAVAYLDALARGDSAKGDPKLPDAPSLGLASTASPGAPSGNFPLLGDDPEEDVEHQPVFTMEMNF